MESRIKDLSKYRFDKAESNLLLAVSLEKDGQYAAALNRAYYAAFDAMRAVNALDSFDSSKHSGVIAYFNQHFVKTGFFSADTSAVIRRSSLLREKSDYEDFFEPEQDETEECIRQIRTFLSDTRVFLTEKHIL